MYEFALRCYYRLLQKLTVSACVYLQNGFSPVIVASSNGHLEVLKLLEKYNGDLFHTDSAKVRQ